jgi:hypothetical protein
MGDRRNSYRVLVGKNEGRRSIRRPRLRWEENGSSRRGIWTLTGSIWLRIERGGGLL